MGWKRLKEHYRIEHMVQITEAGICIGSPYIHDIIVVGMDGKILKRHDGNAGSLGRYQTEIDADPDLARHLIETPMPAPKSSKSDARNPAGRMSRMTA